MDNILLISLHYYRQEEDKSKTFTPPPDIIPVNSLSLMQLAALTPNSYKITALDNPKTINFDKDYDLVAISSVTSSINDAYNISDEFRKRGIKVVLGGWHPSALPEEAKEHADSVVIGEAEKTWNVLLRDISNENIKEYYEQDSPVPSEDISSPRRDIFKDESPIASIQAVWGCPYGCEFCAITNSKFGNKPRFRPMDNIIKEIRKIKQKYLFFCDSSFTINPNYSKELFKNIKEFNKKLLMCNGNADVLARDDEFLKLASEAGCL